MRPERSVDHEQRCEPERHVDEKDPAPRHVVDDEAADQWPEYCRKPEDAAEKSLISPTLARRHDIADHRDRGYDQATAAESLHDAKCDQLRQILRETAKCRSDQKNDNGRL